ncbi:response regulator [Glutamicibacter sp. AOP33-2CA-4]|uniref:response regulator n=1 Tax=Glutamicibacter sp. AOP33-2CA-4 TaxID=3457690 RepID=UPI004033BAB1
MSQITVVICDDQPLIRSSLKLILETDPQLLVIGTAANGTEAVELIGSRTPDIALMDIQMPALDGIAATAQLAGTVDTKIIVLTTFDREDYLFDALDAGASGFLLKNAEPELLLNAVHQIHAGYALLSPEATLKLIARKTSARPGTPAPGAESAALHALTARERQVLTALASGKNNQEIAALLSLSEATVKTHLSNLLAKLHLRDRVQAALYAHRAGLIQ